VTKIQIRVKPNSRECALELLDDGTWLGRVKSPPVDGKANHELVGLIARHFGVPKSGVTIRQGTSGRSKWVEIDN
jgi:uncharacterized protein